MHVSLVITLILIALVAWTEHANSLTVAVSGHSRDYNVIPALCAVTLKDGRVSAQKQLAQFDNGTMFLSIVQAVDETNAIYYANAVNNDWSISKLYAINVRTGAKTEASTSAKFYSLDLDASSGNLYGIGADLDDNAIIGLYAIKISTLQTTRLAKLPIDFILGGERVGTYHPKRKIYYQTTVDGWARSVLQGFSINNGKLVSNVTFDDGPFLRSLHYDAAKDRIISVVEQGFNFEVAAITPESGETQILFSLNDDGPAYRFDHSSFAPATRQVTVEFGNLVKNMGDPTPVKSWNIDAGKATTLIDTNNCVTSKCWLFFGYVPGS